GPTSPAKRRFASSSAGAARRRRRRPPRRGRRTRGRAATMALVPPGGSLARLPPPLRGRLRRDGTSFGPSGLRPEPQKSLPRFFLVPPASHNWPNLCRAALGVEDVQSAGMGVLLNIDAGEHDDEPEELYALAHVVNIACGGHAGDVRSMDRVLAACARNGTLVAAHPSYPDRDGFGRRPMAMSEGALEEAVCTQCATLADRARRV